MSELNADRLSIWDQFEAEIAELVYGASMSLSAAIGILARKCGPQPAELLLLASVSYCANYDKLVGVSEGNAALASLQRYKTAAALASDIAALNGNRRTCEALVEHWSATHDTMFIAYSE